MFRKSLVVCISLAFAVSLTAAGGETASQGKLSAARLEQELSGAGFGAKLHAGKSRQAGCHYGLAIAAGECAH